MIDNANLENADDETIAAYEEIQADLKATANKPVEVETFLSKMNDSIKYMKNHKYELGVFSEAHLISSVVKDTFLFMIEKYFKNDFFDDIYIYILFHIYHPFEYNYICLFVYVNLIYRFLIYWVFQNDVNIIKTTFENITTNTGTAKTNVESARSATESTFTIS